MPSWIGPWEIAIVLIVVLLIFGPRKLPDLGASLGKSIRGFKKGLKETQDEVQSTVSEVREATDIRDRPSTAPVAAAAEAPAVRTESLAEPSPVHTAEVEAPAPSREPVGVETEATGHEAKRTE